MVGWQDIGLVLFIAGLEILLSLDNALALAVLTSKLPHDQRRKALTYGLVGAFVFRLLALLALSYLVQWWWIKCLGGAYLTVVGLRGLLKRHTDEQPSAHWKSFWQVLVMVELTDIVFAIDSALAALAFTNRLWIVYVGGIIGALAMRFVASLLTKLLHRFPKLTKLAELLMALVGLKLMVEGLH